MTRALILILTLCLALAACGGPRPTAHAPTAQAPGPHSLGAVRFGDTDPHPWGRDGPASLAVHGVDVSRFQTAIDWRQARAAGVSFAYIKATEGGDLLDPMFRSHWQAAAAAGVARGAYHFYYHCRSPEEQARWFFANVPRTRGALPPVLDMEWTPTSPTCTVRRPADVIRRDAAVLVAMMTRHYGTRPVLYTTVDFFEHNQMWRLSGVDFWLRSVSAHPSDRYPGQQWTFWQYSSTGTVPGMAGEIDLNTFAGTRAAWIEWLSTRTVP